jgi:hypothetical protein
LNKGAALACLALGLLGAGACAKSPVPSASTIQIQIPGSTVVLEGPNAEGTFFISRSEKGEGGLEKVGRVERLEKRVRVLDERGKVLGEALFRPNGFDLPQARGWSFEGREGGGFELKKNGAASVRFDGKALTLWGKAVPVIHENGEYQMGRVRVSGANAAGAAMAAILEIPEATRLALVVALTSNHF